MFCDKAHSTALSREFCYRECIREITFRFSGVFTKAHGPPTIRIESTFSVSLFSTDSNSRFSGNANLHRDNTLFDEIRNMRCSLRARRGMCARKLYWYTCASATHVAINVSKTIFAVHAHFRTVTHYAHPNPLFSCNLTNHLMCMLLML